MPTDSSNLVVSPHFLESGSIYVFKREFDAYFCSMGRVYVKKDTICQCINESGTLPWEAVQMIESDPGKYLDDITGLYMQMRRRQC